LQSAGKSQVFFMTFRISPIRAGLSSLIVVLPSSVPPLRRRVGGRHAFRIIAKRFFDFLRAAGFGCLTPIG
jgi:hypothetical protein